MIDIRNKCPYAIEVLSDEKIEEAIDDLKRVFCYCESVPPVYMIKSFDAIEEHPKVSYIDLFQMIDCNYQRHSFRKL